MPAGLQAPGRSLVDRDVIKNPVLPQKPGHERLVRLNAQLCGELRIRERGSRICAAMPAGSSGSTSTPLTPSVMISGTPPTRVADDALPVVGGLQEHEAERFGPGGQDEQRAGRKERRHLRVRDVPVNTTWCSMPKRPGQRPVLRRATDRRRQAPATTPGTSRRTSANACSSVSTPFLWTCRHTHSRKGRGRSRASGAAA